MGWLQHVCELALEYAYVPEAVGMVSRPPVCAGLALPVLAPTTSRHSDDALAKTMA